MREHGTGQRGESARRQAVPSPEPAQRRRRRATGALLLVFLLAGSTGVQPSLAHAQDSKQDAKTRYLSGQSHYNLNEFQEALQDFKEAYRMYADPAFLFNIAQCERQLGDLEEAVRFYRNYLRNKPQASNRREVEHKIEELRLLVEAKKTATQGAPQSVLPPAADDVVVPVPSSSARSHTAPAYADTAVVAPAQVIAPVAPPAAAAQIAPASSPSPASPPKLALAADPASTASSKPPSGSASVASASPSSSSSSSEGVDLRAQPSSAAEAPIYQRWWFWAGAAGVVAVGVVAAVALSGGGAAGAPSSGLGNQKVF